MMTNAEAAAKLLRNAASFFRTVGANNADLKKDMEASANAFEAVALRVAEDPTGAVGPLPEAPEADSPATDSPGSDSVDDDGTDQR